MNLNEDYSPHLHPLLRKWKFYEILKSTSMVYINFWRRLDSEGTGAAGDNDTVILVLLLFLLI